MSGLVSLALDPRPLSSVCFDIMFISLESSMLVLMGQELQLTSWVYENKAEVNVMNVSKD